MLSNSYILLNCLFVLFLTLAPFIMSMSHWHKKNYREYRYDSNTTDPEPVTVLAWFILFGFVILLSAYLLQI